MIRQYATAFRLLTLPARTTNSHCRHVVATVTHAVLMLADYIRATRHTCRGAAMLMARHAMLPVMPL